MTNLNKFKYFSILTGITSLFCAGAFAYPPFETFEPRDPHTTQGNCQNSPLMTLLAKDNSETLKKIDAAFMAYQRHGADSYSKSTREPSEVADLEKHLARKSPKDGYISIRMGKSVDDKDILVINTNTCDYSIYFERSGNSLRARKLILGNGMEYLVRVRPLKPIQRK